jgi:hypothetical protein
MEGRADVALKLQMGWHVSQQWACSGSRELRAHTVNHKARRARLEMVWVFKLSETASCDTLPPIRPHLLNLPKQCHQLLNHPSPFGDILVQTSTLTESSVSLSVGGCEPSQEEQRCNQALALHLKGKIKARCLRIQNRCFHPVQWCRMSLHWLQRRMFSYEPPFQRINIVAVSV